MYHCHQSFFTSKKISIELSERDTNNNKLFAKMCLKTQLLKKEVHEKSLLVFGITIWPRMSEA